MLPGAKPWCGEIIRVASYLSPKSGTEPRQQSHSPCKEKCLVAETTIAFILTSQAPCFSFFLWDKGCWRQACQSASSQKACQLPAPNKGLLHQKQITRACLRWPSYPDQYSLHGYKYTESFSKLLLKDLMFNRWLSDEAPFWLAIQIYVYSKETQTGFYDTWDRV